MPPTNALDEFYASAIDMVCQAIGYQAAWEALCKEAEERIEATKRHVFSIDGALTNDIAAIVAKYPNWSVRFSNQDGVRVEIRGPKGEGATTEEAEAITREAQAAFAKYNKLSGVPGIRLHAEMTIINVEGDEDCK